MKLARPLRVVLLAGLCVLACREAGSSTLSPASTPASPRSTPSPAAPAAAPARPLPPDHPRVGADPSAVPQPPAGAGTGEAALAWTVPQGWIAETPSSSLRKAQYRVPGPAGEAECVVFYFGPGQGGDPMANVRRWAGQFQQPDGRKSEEVMKTANFAVGAVKVLKVEVTGTYSGGLGGAPATQKPGSMLLGAIARGPDANWFFKFTGPEKTVRANAAAFEALLRSLKAGS